MRVAISKVNINVKSNDLMGEHILHHCVVEPSSVRNMVIKYDDLRSSPWHDDPKVVCSDNLHIGLGFQCSQVGNMLIPGYVHQSL